MAVTLHDFIRADRHGGDGIAGYLEPGARPAVDPPRFVYWRSANPMLPAFVNCLEGGGDMRRIYTNDERAPWASPRGPGVKRRDVLRPADGDGGLAIEPVPMVTRCWPVRVGAPAAPAPLAGGLHAAAQASATPSADAPDGRADQDPSGPAGPSDPSESARSLRHYALAARTLIAASATSGFAGVHDHVGALLVGDDGAILAADINTGSYRHAEVSLLLSWFRDHPDARTLPAKSIVLSTLTPCRQCTRYLTLARAPDTLVRFDEADRGRSGRVGKRISRPMEGGVDPTPGPVPDGLAREAERRVARNGGDGGGSRIDRSREARRTLLKAAARSRESGPADRSGEASVLTYLARWVSGARRVA